MGNGSIGSLIIARDFQKSLNVSLVLYSQCNQVKQPIKFKGNDIRNVGLKKQPRYVSQASYHCRHLLYLFPFVKYEDYIDGDCKQALSSWLVRGKKKGLDEFQREWNLCTLSATSKWHLPPVQLLVTSLISGFHLINQKNLLLQGKRYRGTTGPILSCMQLCLHHLSRQEQSWRSTSPESWPKAVCLQRCSKWHVFCQLTLKLLIFPLKTLFWMLLRVCFTINCGTITALFSPSMVAYSISDQPAVLSPHGHGNTGDLPKHTMSNGGRMCGRKRSMSWKCHDFNSPT